MKECRDDCPKWVKWLADDEPEPCDMRVYRKEGAFCLYTAVREYHEQCDKMVIRPWHLKENRWLRPGEICLEGDYDMRVVKND